MTTFFTPAILACEKAGVAYELTAIEMTSEHPTAEDYARAVGDARSLFKTIVLKGDKNGIVVCLIPANAKIDYKAVARLTANHKCAMLSPELLTESTGYERGKCSPIGMKSSYPLYIDKSAENFDGIYINAGTEKFLLRVALEDLITMTGAVSETIAQ